MLKLFNKKQAEIEMEKKRIRAMWQATKLKVDNGIIKLEKKKETMIIIVKDNNENLNQKTWMFPNNSN